MKLFKDLTDKDSLYYLNPIDNKVLGFKIKTITGVPPEVAKVNESARYWVKIVVFQNTLALHSPDIEQIPTITFYFDGRKPAQFAKVTTQFVAEKVFEGVPTIFSPSKEYIEEWMKVTG